jgi:phytoene/squalene synthetase
LPLTLNDAVNFFIAWMANRVKLGQDSSEMVQREAEAVSEVPDKERKKPGRKAETPEQRLARLERDLAAARRAVEEAQQRKLVAIGAAVLAEAEGNAAFMEQLCGILHARVTAKAGKEALASLLAHTPVSKPAE